MVKLQMFYRLIATVFFIGYFPFAPATVASAFAMAFLWIFKPSNTVVLSILILSFILGTIASHKFEKQVKKKDPSSVVIDEFVGYLTAVVFLHQNWKVLIAGFFLFRFFDIVKPPPIRLIGRKLSGGIAIMMDDIIAGIITNLLLRVFLML